MSHLTDQEISEIIESIKNDAARQARRTSHVEPSFLLDFIDIDKFIDVLYSMLESEKYILNPQNQTSISGSENTLDVAKFIFTQEYPDFATESRPTVSVSISRREPASLSAEKEPFKGTKVYRPMYLGEENDGIDGNVKIFMQTVYDNELEFTCWSPRLKSARQLASLFEAIMQKYYYILRRHVPVLVYQGRGEMRTLTEYGDGRYFGIPLRYFVRTNERFTLDESELKNIIIEL